MRQAIASFFYSIAQWFDPHDPEDDPVDIELLRSEFQQYENGSWEANMKVRSEAGRFLSFLGASVLHDADFQATSLEIGIPGEGTQQYKVAIHRVDGKTPSERLNEMKEEADEALDAAVSAIYFQDSSAYEAALWNVVETLNPELADRLKKDPRGAYEEILVHGDE